MQLLWEGEEETVDTLFHWFAAYRSGNKCPGPICAEAATLSCFSGHFYQKLVFTNTKIIFFIVSDNTSFLTTPFRFSARNYCFDVIIRLGCEISFLAKNKLSSFDSLMTKTHIPTKDRDLSIFVIIFPKSFLIFLRLKPV